MNFNLLPHVFILGPPSGGKTTVRSIVSNWFDERGYSLPAYGIEEAHRELLPKGKNDPHYRYDPAGALVLLDPNRQIPEALAYLVQTCRIAACKTGFVEFTHKEPVVVIDTFGRNLISHGLFLYVFAPLVVRQERNLTRGSRCVPLHVVNVYMSTLEVQLAELIGLNGGVLRTIGTNRSMEDLKTRVEFVLDEYYDSQKKIGGF